MNPANRTLAFVLVAACSVGIAVGAHRMYQPTAATTRTDVGTAFYPDFQESTSATSLGVAAYNTEANKVDEFRVERRDGQWRIPSHHNYPADAKDRLGRTAASMIGVTRGQLVDTTAASHERLNLIDPLDTKATGTEGRGSRITLKAGDTVLTDLIIGKKDEAPGTDRYYVRRADEDRVYLAEIRPDLTTKFTDWIQPNVLDATASTFRQIILDRYSVDETQGKLVPGERSALARDSSSDEWKLEELPEGKKVKTSVVNQITSALADMKIVGVRPKTPGIAALIKGDPKARRTAIDMLDMQDKGYFDDGNGGIVSNSGDFLAGTSDGIIYVLRFGKAVRGDDVDIEIGDSKKLSEEEAQKALEDRKAEGTDQPAGDKPPADDPSKEGDKDESTKQNRFVFVTAQVSEKLLGEAPVEPVKPTPPPGYTPKEKPATPSQPAIPGFNTPGSDKPVAPPTEPKKETSAVQAASRSLAGPGADPVQDEKKPETPAADEKPADQTTPAESPAAPPAATDPPASPATEPAAPDAQPEGDAKAPVITPAVKDPVAEYEAALAKYEQELDEYRVRKAEYDEKLKKAKEREKTLNERFAPWYYVIPADVFNSINVKPEELVEPESAATTNAPPTGSPLPELGTAPAPAATPPATPPVAPAATPGTSDPAPAAPPADAPKSEPATTDAAKPEPPATEPASPPPATDSTPQPE